MADIDLIIAVHTDGIKQVTDLSASLRNLSANIAGINVPMSKLDTHTRALNKALGMGARGAKEHATSFKGLIQNQKVLSTETKNLTKDIKAMNAIMRAGHTTDLINPATVKNLKTLQTTLKNMRLRAFSSDVQSIGLNLKKLGKDAQFVGRSLMINLTAPFTLMSRYGLKALTDIDKEAVRLTKVMDGVAMSIEQAMAKTGQGSDSSLVKELTQNFEFLDSALTGVSAKYGIAKSLTVGLAADFAELGLGAKESVAAITELTAATEKLGGMDISQSQDLIQAMYFQSIRAFDQAGRAFESAAAKERAAIESSTAQLQMFNAIENTTALTMRDLGDAFPEVASMATTFGLSMTEAAAMLAPMKAAGLEVARSANAIKVSLQRLVAPTKANAELLSSLSESYRNTTQGADAFNNATRSGLTGLLGIVESFTAIRDSSAGMEGAMQLMAKIFGVRQGPRMMIAIQQLALFNDELTKADPLGKSVAKTLTNLANGASNSSKLAIKNFTDIGIVARVATAQVGQQVENFGVVTAKDIKDANAARKAVADEILRANREGRDIMSEISTEAGRSMIVELAGSASASVLAQRELDAALKSLDVTLSKIKNNFKIFAADLLNSTRPAIEKIAEVTSKLIDKWNSLSATTKKTVGVLVMSITGALAAIGPLILAFGTLSSVTGIAMRGIFKFIPSLKNAEGGFIGLADAIGKSGNKLDALYNSFASNKILVSSTAGIAAAAGLPMGPGATAAAAAAGTTPSSRPFKFARVKGVITQVGGVGMTAPGGVGPVMPGSTRGLTAARRAYALEELALKDRAGITTTPTGRLMQSPTLNIRDRWKQLDRGTGSKKRFISADPVNEAMERRLSAFDKAGIRRAAGGTLINERGRSLSEGRALRIARGGVGGRISEVLQRGREARYDIAGATPGGVGRGILAGQRRLVTQPLTSARGLATAGVGKVKDLDAYKNAMARVAAAQKELRINQMAFGKGAVSTFSQAKTSLMAFMNTQKLATIVAKAFRVAMISSGIGIVLLAIGVAIYAVMKNFDKFKAVASSGIEKVKVAFDILKGAAMEIIRPFVDLFATFGKGGEDGAGAAEGIGAAFNKIAGVIQFLAKMVHRFVTQFIQPYLYMVINIVMAVVEAFQGNWSKAFDYVKAAFGFFIELLVNGIALGIKIILKSVGMLAKGMISLFGMAIKVWIEIAFAGVTLIMKAISFIPGIGSKINNAYRGVINGIKGTVDAVTGAVNGGIDSTVNGMSGLVDAGAKAVKGSLKSLQGSGVKKSTGKMFDGGKEVAKTKGDEVGQVYNEAITNAVGEGLGDSLKDAAGKAFKDSVKDLAQRLQDYVMGEMSNALSKLQKKLEESLKKQKDAALAVYDSQVDTLNKLARAEESLTKTKEYEAARRQAIEERALQSQNYIRNRALAIYEGRIDDARMLDLQDRKDAIDSTKSIGQLDSSRKKDLAAENLDALKTAIATAREEADKFFDTTAVKFGEAAAEILKFPPVTKQDYIDQMTSLTELAKTTANDSGIEFSKMFDAFASTINTKMPNDVVGAFTTNLDDLVKVAVEKYGLGKGTSDNKTIIGSTIGMLMDMGGAMDGNRQFVVDSFGTITTGLKDNMSDGLTEITTTIYSKFVDDFDKAVTDADPTTVYQKAIKDGNKAILDDFRKTVGGVGSEVDNMIDLLDPLIKKWAALEAQAKAAGDAQAAAANGGGTPSTPTSATMTGGTYGGINMNSTSAAYWASVNKALGIAPRLTPIIGPNRWMGGMIPSFARGGYLDKAMSQSIPAMLHGGEYIVSAKAVQNIGAATLQNLNNMRFNAPKNSAPSAGQSVTMSTQNTNIYVDNFIGEEEWFNSMMKEYNVNVLPKNQKAAGVQPRVVRSYNGINQGL
jgi:phage-related protein